MSFDEIIKEVVVGLELNSMFDKLESAVVNNILNV